MVFFVNLSRMGIFIVHRLTTDAFGKIIKLILSRKQCKVQMQFRNIFNAFLKTALIVYNGETDCKVFISKTFSNQYISYKRRDK